MKKVERENIIAEAVRRYGAVAQKEMAIEECAELINALQKEKRGRNKRPDVIEEIADVIIMCEQLICIYSRDDVFFAIDRKLERLQNMMAKL